MSLFTQVRPALGLEACSEGGGSWSISPLFLHSTSFPSVAADVGPPVLEQAENGETIVIK